jgi:hypothetical protein
MGEPAIWIGIVALIISVVVGIGGYLQKKPFVSLGSYDNLRREAEELRAVVVRLTTRVASLETHLDAAISEREFWQDEYRKLRNQSSFSSGLDGD